MALQEREVLAGQLVLQGLGGRGDDRLLAGEHGGHEVGERLARARAGLHREVPLGGDRLGDGDGHLRLARSLLACGQGLRDALERYSNLIAGGHLATVLTTTDAAGIGCYSRRGAP